MPRDLSRRQSLPLAAAALGRSDASRLIIDTRLEVWTFHAKFLFHHPEHPERKRVAVEAPVEDGVADMWQFGLK
jgi:hypothetical protein